MSPLPPQTSASDAVQKVAALRAAFEALQRDFARYLDGLERVPPLAARDAFVVALRQAQVEGPGNHAARLQLQNLRASWAAYAPRYERALLQMEAGTYLPQHRRLARAAGARRAAGEQAFAPGPQVADAAATPEARRRGPGTGDGPAALRDEAGDSRAMAANAAPPAAHVGAPPEGRAATGAQVEAAGTWGAGAIGPGADEALGRLHAAWAAAATSSGARVPSREALAAVVAHKVADVRARTGQRQVEVRVVLEHGAPVLQVVPKLP